MSIHLTIQNRGRPNLRTVTPKNKGPLISGGSSWEYDLLQLETGARLG